MKNPPYFDLARDQTPNLLTAKLHHFKCHCFYPLRHSSVTQWTLNSKCKQPKRRMTT
ncbi:hypothetical protein HOLleu_25971 [Holothuria leucospilota]|uniref:Uncharacterized protein n=1 Tax=Holothuria leucospilota TaxID=206669 RepID=A0A9Q1H3W0_HOLLE|nr:hypothetical protein HOLleu_25971 [Holothuria leucospilota]